MGSHSVEPESAPLTRRRLREVERTTDPTPEVSAASGPRTDPHSPVSVRSGPTPAVAPRTPAPTSPRSIAAGPDSTSASGARGVQNPPAQVTRYVSRPSAEPAVATTVRPMLSQPSPVVQAPPAASPQPAASDGPATPPTGRRAARAAAAPSTEADALAPVTTSAPVSTAGSRRAARASTPADDSSAPVRRARPRAQSSVAIPVLPDRVTPTTVSAPARPQSVLVTQPADVTQVLRATPAVDATQTIDVVPADLLPGPHAPLPAPHVSLPSPHVSPNSGSVPATDPAPVADRAPATDSAPTAVVATKPEAAAIVATDPAPHRPSRVVRTASPAEETAIVPAILATEQEPWELADTGEVATTQAPEAAPHTVTRRSGRSTRVAARLGVLSVLAGITVIIPVSQGLVPAPVAFGSDALADSTLPSTVTALAGSQLSDLPPASLVSADGALASREVTGASRNDIRSSLPGCEGSVREAGQNGLLKEADLCTLWDNHTQLRADAAVSLADFNQAFAARFGADLCLSSGYRTLAEQRAVKAQKGGLAAAPGKSNHGWGLAVDLCQDQTSGAKWAWLNENGPAYGWANPEWAQPGGSGPHERWHWEYVKGVQADGEYYDG